MNKIAQASAQCRMAASQSLPAKMEPPSSKIVVLSSSLLTDRMLRYSGWGETLEKAIDVEIWATASHSQSDKKVNGAIPTSLFPRVKGFREFPHNYLRRLNEFNWDYRLRAPSRLSMIEKVHNRTRSAPVKALKLPARLMACTGLHRAFESRLNRMLLAYSRSPEARERLRELKPAALVATGPHRYEEPAVVAEAINLGIPTMALITSWDNLTTKGRMLFEYDGYMVWSEQMKRELHEFYPHSHNVPVTVVGAPQFDVFFQERFHQSRDEFCHAQGLDASKPHILYALGSPNFLKEHHGALAFAQRVQRGELGDVQVLVRPHPLFDKGEEAGLLRGLGAGVVVQRTGEADKALTARTQDFNQIKEWVNTFRHASVVVNFSSTVGIDAAICDKPVVNLDFDPEPGQPNQALVKDVNHLWSHFKPIAESGGMWLANDMGEVVHAVREYLAHPELHREKRRWMAEYVCGYIDGKCGERMAQAILDFVHQKTSVR
jgi:hypothetical protein